MTRNPPIFILTLAIGPRMGLLGLSLFQGGSVMLPASFNRFCAQLIKNDRFG
jgi:hypothetical protein